MDIQVKHIVVIVLFPAQNYCKELFNAYTISLKGFNTYKRKYLFCLGLTSSLYI